jgi:hypothetical protein
MTGKYSMFNSLVMVAVFAATLMLVGNATARSQYRVLHNFTGGKGGENGPSPGTLLLDGKGNLYGSTPGGGGNGCAGYGCGTIFELTPRRNGPWKQIALYSFPDGKNGFPNSSLAFDTSGNLYGTALWDGGISRGSVFQLVRRQGNWTLNVLYHLGSTAGVVLDKAGNLYGSVGLGKYGNGAISEFIRGSKGWSLKTLYSFCGRPNCPDGEDPLAPLTWDAAGNLYGTTLNGGNGPPKCLNSGLGCGVAFQMTPNSDGTWTYHVLHRFAAFKTDGQFPDGGLVLDASGAAYGVTAYGGVHGNGTVFKLTLSSGGRWKQTVLYDFPTCANGCLPGTTLVFGKAGNLYGVGSGGLADCQGYDCGVVFKLSPQAGGKWKYSVVHKFTGKDGGFPNGVIIDAKGNLYGTTQAFGAYGYGVAYQLKP